MDAQQLAPLYQALREANGYVPLTTIKGVHIPAVHHKYSGRGEKMPFTIIYSHGNAEDLGLNYLDLQDLGNLLGCDVFAYEYPGYGGSDPNSEPSEQGCYEAANAAWDYVTNVTSANGLHVDPRAVILFGRSLGSGPTVDLASRHPEAGGVILESPLTSAIRTQCCDCVAIALCCIDVFASVDKVHKIKSPTFIMHGTDDQVVPFANGKRLYESLDPEVAREPFWVEGAGHNDMHAVAGNQMTAKTIEFLEYCATRYARAEQNTRVAGADTAGYEGRALPRF